MDKPLSTYKWFDVIELIFGVASFLGSIASIYGLYFVIKPVGGQKENTTMIVMFVVVVIFSGLLFLTKLFKFKAQSAYHLHLFSARTHSICHEMRDFYIRLFESWQKTKKKDVADLSRQRKEIAEIGTRHLSAALNKTTAANINVSVKVFRDESIKVPFLQSNKKKSELREELRKLDLDLETIAVAENGENMHHLPPKIGLKSHTLYNFALIDIFTGQQGVFQASSSKTFIYKALESLGEDSVFYHPYGDYKLQQNSNDKKEIVCINRIKDKDWFELQKGIIAVPISNEFYQKNDIEKSRIFGIIKVTADSAEVFKMSDDLLAYIEMTKTFADTMYKCFERIDFYCNCEEV